MLVDYYEVLHLCILYFSCHMGSAWVRLYLLVVSSAVFRCFYSKGYIQLFTKEAFLPKALRNIPYDVNSVMHFGERDYSKNGHKTITFKNRSFRQDKNGLTLADIKKIELVYGPECRIRDRAEKIAICQTYPGLRRRKREIIEPPANMSLRVNPNITPPPDTLDIKPNRTKREASNTVTTSESSEEIEEKEEKEEQKPPEIKNEGKKKTNLKEKVRAMKKRLKKIKKDHSTIKSKVVSSTTDSKVKDDKEDPTGRKFSEKRFKIQKSRVASDWEESDISLDKQIEPEHTLTKNKEILKKVLHLGVAGSLFGTEKAKKESVEEVNIVEKAKPAESSAESTNTNEDLEATEEEETTVTIKQKEHEKIEESSLEEVESSENEEMPVKSKLPKTVELTKLNRDFYSDRKWPDGDVIYVVAKLLDYDLEDVRKRLAAVNSILVEKTCVRLREVDAKEAPGFDNYMILDSSPDYVTGKVGGKQIFGTIELFEGGHHKQHTAMVVMAMLGFYFEVSRHDRDKYITVHNRHIRADKLHHFEKIGEEATLDVPYDFKSATHPAWQFWRRVGKKGIATVATFKDQDPDSTVMRQLGQNPELLSETDILRINSVYGIECFQSNRTNKKESVRMLEDNDDVIQ